VASVLALTEARPGLLAGLQLLSRRHGQATTIGSQAHRHYAKAYDTMPTETATTSHQGWRRRDPRASSSYVPDFPRCYARPTVGAPDLVENKNRATRELQLGESDTPRARRGVSSVIAGRTPLA